MEQAVNARVLVVHPDPSLRSELTQALRAAGHDVDAVDSGERAIDRFIQAPADVLVVNLTLPGRDGVATIESVRWAPQGNATSFVLMGTRSRAEQVIAVADELGTIAVPDGDTHAVVEEIETALFGRDRTSAAHLPGSDSAVVQSFDDDLYAPRSLRPVPIAGSPVDQVAIREAEDVAHRAQALDGARLEGRLETTAFPLLLSRLGGLRASGALLLDSVADPRPTVTGDSPKKVIFFRNGIPAQVRSNLEEECLGRRLLHRGKIDRYALNESLARVHAGDGRQGSILVAMGAITPHELREALEDQQRVKLFDIFAWADGVFRFSHEMLAPVETISLEMSLAEIVYRGICSWMPPLRLMKLIRPYASQVVAVVKSDFAGLHRLVDPHGQAMLDSLRDAPAPAKVQSILDRENSQVGASRILYAGYCLGCLDFRSENRETMLPQPPPPDPFGALRRHVHRLLTRLRGGQYADAIGIPRGAAPEAIDSAVKHVRDSIAAALEDDAPAELRENAMEILARLGRAAVALLPDPAAEPAPIQLTAPERPESKQEDALPGRVRARGGAPRDKEANRSTSEYPVAAAEAGVVEVDSGALRAPNSLQSIPSFEDDTEALAGTDPPILAAFDDVTAAAPSAPATSPETSTPEPRVIVAFDDLTLPVPPEPDALESFRAGGDEPLLPAVPPLRPAGQPLPPPPLSPQIPFEVDGADDSARGGPRAGSRLPRDPLSAAVSEAISEAARSTAHAHDLSEVPTDRLPDRERQSAKPSLGKSTPVGWSTSDFDEPTSIDDDDGALHFDSDIDRALARATLPDPANDGGIAFDESPTDRGHEPPPGAPPIGEHVRGGASADSLFDRGRLDGEGTFEGAGSIEDDEPTTLPRAEIGLPDPRARRPTHRPPAHSSDPSRADPSRGRPARGRRSQSEPAPPRAARETPREPRRRRKRTGGEGPSEVLALRLSKPRRATSSPPPERADSETPQASVDSRRERRSSDPPRESKKSGRSKRPGSRKRRGADERRSSRAPSKRLASTSSPPKPARDKGASRRRRSEAAPRDERASSLPPADAVRPGARRTSRPPAKRQSTMPPPRRRREAAPEPDRPSSRAPSSRAPVRPSSTPPHVVRRGVPDSDPVVGGALGKKPKLGTEPGALDERVDRMLQAERHYRKGKRAMAREKYEKAVEALTRAVELVPDEGEFLVHLGWARFLIATSEKARERALQEIHAGCALVPKLDTAHLLYARALRSMGNEAAARNAYERALAANPDCREALLELRELAP